MLPGGGREEIGLLDYGRVVLRRRWTVLAASVSVALVALVASFVATPLYKATATLQIERRNPDILTFRDLSQIDYSWAAYTDFYQTQYKLIGGDAVARLAVARAGLAEHPRLAADEAPGLLARLRAIVPRRTTAGAPSDPLDPVTARILARLEVAPVRNSQLVRVSWVSPDAELSSRVANAVAEAYIQHTMEAQFSTGGQAQEFLVDQIATLKREIAEIEHQLQSYGEAKRIVSVDEASNITLEALRDIGARRTEARTALAAAAAVREAVERSPPDALPEVMNSLLIQELRREHASLEAALTEQSRKFGADWPAVRTQASKLAQAASRLEEETRRIAEQVRAAARSAHDRALGELTRLDALVAGQESAAQTLKRDAVEFTNLHSETQKKRETLEALLGRQNEIALSTRLKDLEATSSNIRVVERAKIPRAPFRPNVRLNLALGVALGLLVGLGLALLLDHLDNTIASAEELQQIAGLPVLAAIPRHGAATSALGRPRRARQAPEPGTLDLVSHRDGRAGAAEAYRDLRTSLLLSSPGRPPRRIVITSALPEEGKTATATNLAIVLAQLGARVLLVDTDLRRPRLHRVFDVPNRRGTSNVLSGLEEDPRRLVLASGVERLDLLPSGPVPPNPSELLNSPTFVQLGQRFLDAGYDHVIFDSPPVLSVADPIIVAAVMDSCLLVVRAGSTPRPSVRLAVDKLRQASGVTLGLLLNDLAPDAPGRSGYGYYRAYGRYGEEAEGDTPRSAAGGGASA